MGVFHLPGIGAEANDAVVGEKADQYEQDGSNHKAVADLAFQGIEPRGGRIRFCCVQSSSPGASERLLEVR